jgi:predicted transcriptional regulator of viral defense system
MNKAAAYAALRRFGSPVFTTDDARLALRVSPENAAQLLGRLAALGLVARVRHGLWTIEPEISPLRLVEHVTAPYPAYVSFLTSLHQHDMSDQIPRMVYVATTGRPGRVETSRGVFSVHHIDPALWGGFEVDERALVPVATPEKTIFDMLYLASSRDRTFARMTDIRLPRGFRRREVRQWIARIGTLARRRMVEQRFNALLEDQAAERQWRAAGGEVG